MVNEQFIPVNPFSRPGNKRTYTRNIIWHYTGNPGASAENHFNYFGKNLANQNPFDDVEDTYASAHAFIDRTQTLVIIPLDEMAYHANQANPYSIGVELCIESDWTFHPDTVKRAVEFGADLAKQYCLSPLADFLRHYDITGKICPKPWVDDPAAWDKFKIDVKNKMGGAPDFKPLDQGVALTILRTWIKPAWQDAFEENDTEQCGYIAWLGQELRAAAGLPADAD